MKKLTVVLMFLFVLGAFQFSLAAGTQPAAQMDKMPPCMMGMDSSQMCKGMAGDGQQMTSMCQSMMPHMMEKMLAIQEMTHMMKDMMRIQEQLLRGASKQERKKMAGELSRMIERMDRMLTDMQSMPCMMHQGMPMKDMMGAPPAEPSKSKEDPGKDEGKKTEPHKHH